MAYTHHPRWGSLISFFSSLRTNLSAWGGTFNINERELPPPTGCPAYTSSDGFLTPNRVRSTTGEKVISLSTANSLTLTTYHTRGVYYASQKGVIHLRSVDEYARSSTVIGSVSNTTSKPAKRSFSSDYALKEPTGISEDSTADLPLSASVLPPLFATRRVYQFDKVFDGGRVFAIRRVSSYEGLTPGPSLNGT